MSHRALALAGGLLLLAPDGPGVDPHAPTPPVVVTQADVERILTQARLQPDFLVDPLGMQHPLYCWQHDCVTAALAEEPRFGLPALRHAMQQAGDGQDGQDPNNPPPEADKPYDPEEYEYPFPEDAGEAVVGLLKQADAKRREAQRKPPQLDLFEEANDLYESAVKTGKQYAYPWYRVAQNCQAILEFKKAKEAIGKALRIDPKSPHLLTEEGDIHVWHGDRKRALVSYDKALEIDPKFVPALLSRAGVRQQQHEWQLAKVDIEAAIKLEPNAKPFKMMLDRLQIEIDNMGFTGDHIIVKETSHYRIFCHDRSLADLVAAHAEAIYAYYVGCGFPTANLGSNLKFSVYLFANMQDYFKAGAPKNSGGYYSPGVRKLVLPVNFKDKWKPGATPTDANLRNTLLVLYHEGFHQFLHYSLERAPQWFNEGHGDFYGGARWDPRKKRPGGGIGYFNIGLMDWRTETIKRMGMFQGPGRYELPQRLMQMTQAEMYANGAKNYAQAWSIVHFLHTRQELGSQLLVPYYKELRKGLGLRTAFDKTFGRTDMNKFEEMWVDFAKAKQK